MTLFQHSHKSRCHNGPAGSAHKEGHHIRKKCRLFSHKDHGHRITEHPAQDASSNYFSQVCGQQLSGPLIQETAEQGPHHAPRKGQEASGPHEIPDQGGTEGGHYSVART